MAQKKFIETTLAHAKKTEEKTGIHHLFILAQAALESGWGKNCPGNMYFGVKASEDTPEHKKQLLRTKEVFPEDKYRNRFPEVLQVVTRKNAKSGKTEYIYSIRDWFRKYDTPEECFSDHADFFFRNKRYAEALKVAHDPYLFAEEVAKAGYATDPQYADKLKEIIRKIEALV